MIRLIFSDWPDVGQLHELIGLGLALERLVNRAGVLVDLGPTLVPGRIHTRGSADPHCVELGHPDTLF